MTIQSEIQQNHSFLQLYLSQDEIDKIKTKRQLKEALDKANTIMFERITKREALAREMWK